MSIRNGHARWAFNLSAWEPTITDYMEATKCVQKEEKERLAKFVFRNDFNASLIGRLLMRQFVHQATNLDYNLITFARDARGKPYLATNVKNYNIHFNVSHQGSYSLLAGFVNEVVGGGDSDTSSKSIKIGVDVMETKYSGGKDVDEFFRLMDRNFSIHEWKYINKHRTDDDKIRAFMRLWCLKESYVKNIGVGITVDLQMISFNVTSPILRPETVCIDTTLTVAGVDKPNWLFEESLIDEEHCVAVSIENLSKNESEDYTPLSFEILDFKQLMENSLPLLTEDLDYCEGVVKKTYKN